MLLYFFLGIPPPCFGKELETPFAILYSCLLYTSPHVPFQYGFLDQAYENLYKAETNAGKILSSAMFVILLISIVGLFAMAFYSTQRRVKEIGVRKVNGATVGEILLVLNRDFLIWVLIAFAVACPIAYIFISRWLENFSVGTEISWWIFAIVGLIVSLDVYKRQEYRVVKTG